MLFTETDEKVDIVKVTRDDDEHPPTPADAVTVYVLEAPVTFDAIGLAMFGLFRNVDGDQLYVKVGGVAGI